jgi:hypothetical protein
MISALSIPCRHRRAAEVAVAELALDDDQRHAFVGDLDCVRVAELVRSEAPADSGGGSRSAQLGSGGRARPEASAGRPLMTQKSGPMGSSCRVEPRLQLLPGPFVHADFAPSATFAVADQERAAAMVEIRLAERKRFLDAETGSPEHGDEAARTPGMDSITGGAHDRPDLLDVRWLRRIADALVAWRTSRMCRSPEVHGSVEEERDGR